MATGGSSSDESDSIAEALNRGELTPSNIDRDFTKFLDLKHSHHKQFITRFREHGENSEYSWTQLRDSPLARGHCVQSFLDQYGMTYWGTSMNRQKYLMRDSPENSGEVFRYPEDKKNITTTLMILLERKARETTRRRRPQVTAETANNVDSQPEARGPAPSPSPSSHSPSGTSGMPLLSKSGPALIGDRCHREDVAAQTTTTAATTTTSTSVNTTNGDDQTDAGGQKTMPQGSGGSSSSSKINARHATKPNNPNTEIEFVHRKPRTRQSLVEPTADHIDEDMARPVPESTSEIRSRRKRTTEATQIMLSENPIVTTAMPRKRTVTTGAPTITATATFTSAGTAGACANGATLAPPSSDGMTNGFFATTTPTPTTTTAPNSNGNISTGSGDSNKKSPASLEQLLKQKHKKSTYFLVTASHQAGLSPVWIRFREDDLYSAASFLETMSEGCGCGVPSQVPARAWNPHVQLAAESQTGGYGSGSVSTVAAAMAAAEGMVMMASVKLEWSGDEILVRHGQDHDWEIVLKEIHKAWVSKEFGIQLVHQFKIRVLLHVG